LRALPEAGPAHPTVGSEPVIVGAEPGAAAFRRISVALFLAGFSTFSLIYAVQPLLPNLAAEFHVSATESALALSATTGLLAFAILCASALSEAVGRRGLMFASMTGAAALHLGSAVAPDWHTMLALRALEGLVLGGVPAVAMTYLAEEIHPKALGSAMGLYVGGTAFGAMMGRVSMGLLTEVTSWRVAFEILGLLDLVVALGFILLLPASRNFRRKQHVTLAYHAQAWLGHLRRPGLPALFLTGFLVLGVFVATFNYLTFRLSAAPYGFSPSQISVLFTAFLFGVVASPIAGRMADRFSRGTVLGVGVLIMLGGMALSLLPTLSGLIAGVIAVTIGFFIAHAVASGWVGRLAATHKGHAASLYLLSYYLGSSTMGLAAGWAWAAGGWGAVAGFNGALLLVALAAAWRLRRLERVEG